MNTLGTKILVLISEVSLFQGENNMWKFQIETGYYSVVYFEHITDFDVLWTKLLLGAGLICASWMHQIFMHLHSVYEPHP